MTVLVFFFIAGPLLLIGYLSYICRGRRYPRAAKRQIKELQALYDIEHREEHR